MDRIHKAFRRWWHTWVIADDETSKRLDAAECRLTESPFYHETHPVEETCWNCGASPPVRCCEFGRDR